MCDSTVGLCSLLYKIMGLLNGVLPVLIALGVVYLVWGIVQYVINESEEAKSKGKNTIIFGIIGLAVIVSVWGLVNLITNTLNFNAGDNAAPEAAKLRNLLPKPYQPN